MVEKMAEFSPKFLEGVELRNSVTQALDIKGARVDFHENPGITVVEFPTNGDNLAAIWFNDESGKGLFTLEGLRDLNDKLNEINVDTGVDGVILTDNLPEDSKVSFYGVDINNVFGPIFEKVSYGKPEDMEDLLRLGQTISGRIRTLQKPLVSTARRLAVGGGFEFMIASHAIIQGPQASYWLPECSLDVPEFVSKQYDLKLQNKDYRSGKVLFPGWLGDFRLLNKLMEKGMNPDKALKTAQDFGFNCARMSALQAQELGVADFTVAAETDLIPQAIAFLNQPLAPTEQDLLSIPNILINNEINLESPGTKARYYLEHMFRGQTVAYDRVAEMAIELMIDAMTHGLTNRPLPYGNKKVFE